MHFFNAIFIYLSMQIIVESLRNMALLFDGQISDLSQILWYFYMYEPISFVAKYSKIHR